MKSHAHFAVRSDDGRLQRSEASRQRMAATVLADVVARGDFQPKLSVLIEQKGSYKQKLCRLFGSRRLLLNRIARTAPAEVVDAIGLSPAARAALGERDVRAIAWAVLAGRRLERGA